MDGAKEPKRTVTSGCQERRSVQDLTVSDYSNNFEYKFISINFNI